MPHITLQYKEKGEKVPELKSFFQDLHTLLHETAGIAYEHCKSRLIPVSNHLVGDGQGDQSFVHLEIRLIEGRPLEIKQKIGNQSVALLKQYFATTGQISVELIEMQKSLYFKHPPLS